MSLPALSDLFRRHRAKESGVWRLGLDPHRTVFLDHGDIVFAQSTHPQDRLTSILVERGLLTQAQLDYAMANLKPGLSVGKNLIDMGFITQRVLLDVARLQVERVVWGAMAVPEEVPAFEARELESSVVRLPFETPLLLLSGLLGLQDREQVLELLGPLNQVVVLEGKRLLELTLPADLAKLPPLLDGSRTLLELARESGVEPLRMGAFALFLREMGWARLHELPPLDRGALDLALSPEPEPASPPFPEPSTAELSPSLFASIEAAAKPTTNLEHLSEALDSLPEVPPALLPEEEEPRLPVLPEATPVEAEEGQAELPTPNLELPPLEAPEPEPEPEPEPRIHLPLVEEPQHPDLPPPPSGVDRAETSPLPWGRIAVGLLMLALLLGGGYYWKSRPRTATPLPEVMPPETKAPETKAPETKAPEPPPETKDPETKPEPKAPEPPADPKAARLLALRKGDLGAAQALSEDLVKREPKAWTLRLLIACQTDTLQNLPDLFAGTTPDLFVVPMTMRDGRTCTQVFFGVFPSQRAADEAAAKLPPAFQGKGNRPKAFAMGSLPKTQ